MEWVSEQMEGDDGTGEVGGRRMFQPLLSLMVQRLGVVPSLA